MREYAPTARPYELMTIFSPEVADDMVTEQLEVITSYVRTAGGAVYQVLQDAPWGRRRFAYPIRHNGRDVRDGFYSVVHFDLVPSQVFEVERDLKLDERVLRFLLTVHDVKEAAAGAAETNEGEAVAVDPVPRTEIAAGDLIRNAETARAAADAAREASEAARAAAEAARPQQNTNRDDRSRPAAQPASETPAAAVSESAPSETAEAVADSSPATVGVAAAVAETESVAEAAPAPSETPATDAPIAEIDATATAEPAADAPSEPETDPADDAGPARA